MFPRWQIDAVPPSRCDEALLLLVAGAAGDGLVCARMEALRGLLQARGQYPPRIWCARSNRSTLSAAMVMETPGRIGALLFTSPQAAGVNEEALIETITAASRDALAEQGLAFVQAMLDPQEAREIAVVGAAGLDRLAELAHMQLDLTHSPSPWPVDGLTWQR